MVFRWLAVLVLGLALTAGCGWSPPSAPSSEPDKCAESDEPTPETVTKATGQLPKAGDQPWHEVSRGHTKDCRLYWVQVGAGNVADDPQHLLFFDRNVPLGTATPEPRPYTTVTQGGDDSLIVQYQWRQGDDEPCCPTGIATVRFMLDGDKVKALDPIPAK